MDYKEKYKSWLDSAYIDQDTKDELKNLKEEEIQDRFYKDLSFGTAGLRGIMGAGSNRLNIYSIGLVTQAIAELIKDLNAQDRGVSIAYDVRNNSEYFARSTASILGENGIKVYIYPDVRPTPMLSFAVRNLKTQAGINITASHNPKEYNGYKVYWEEGSQILDHEADKISDKLKELEFEDIKFGDFDKLLDQGLIEFISSDVDESYYKTILDHKIYDDIDKDITVVYTPLNGTGLIPVTKILEARGFTNINLVKEESDHDGNFPNVGYPNPENPKAFAGAERLGEKIDADLLFATDPDSDRVAMAAKDKSGDYYFFNGNQTGVLLINYILEGLSATDRLEDDHAIVKSIVTGDMIEPICNKHSVKLFNTLTGFKYICAYANEWDETGEYKFLFGFEESIGYTFGDYVRDKDAVISSMMIVEMAAYYKKQGLSLYEKLYDLYEEYGYYKEKLVSLRLEGKEGQERIGSMMDSIRTSPIEEISNLSLDKTIDYLNDNTGIPKANVLEFVLEDGSWYTIRPSGTEPLIKIYIYTKDEDEDLAEKKIDLIQQTVIERLESVS